MFKGYVQFTFRVFLPSFMAHRPSCDKPPVMQLRKNSSTSLVQEDVVLSMLASFEAQSGQRVRELLKLCSSDAARLKFRPSSTSGQPLASTSREEALLLDWGVTLGQQEARMVHVRSQLGSVLSVVRALNCANNSF